MHCGCISLGYVHCDGCQRTIPYPERYLVIDEAGGRLHLCIDCSSARGYVQYSEEKEQRTLTFFSKKP
jgi:hypothetical protein